MSPSSLGRQVRWPGPAYEIKVRGTAFLWGSSGIVANIVFDTPLLLHIRNDLFGEVITVGTSSVGMPPATLGTLQAGEVVSIPLNTVTGVFATCDTESTVNCQIG